MSKNNYCDLSPCSPKPGLQKRELVQKPAAKAVAGIFKVLSNDTRVRLLHALAIESELSVSDLAGKLKMKPQAVSNQLRKLASSKLLETRRDGNSIFYKIVDPCVPELLSLGLCLMEDSNA